MTKRYDRPTIKREVAALQPAREVVEGLLGRGEAVATWTLRALRRPRPLGADAAARSAQDRDQQGDRARLILLRERSVNDQNDRDLSS